MMSSAPIYESTTWNTLQLQLVAGQHLVLKGIEILTRASNSPKLKFASNDKGESSR